MMARQVGPQDANLNTALHTSSAAAEMRTFLANSIRAAGFGLHDKAE